MSDALNIFFQIYQQFMNTVFNSLYIEHPIDGLPGTGGVTIGWVFICIIIMSILIRNILAVPHKGQTITREYPYSANRYEKKWH